ncbi:MAG: glutaredoxin family protein [archaeon GBS-70-058]|nr:glutaredoxin family protein [Candidatus Culexarchaeum nevadense]
MSIVKVYTAPNCPLCLTLKNFLASIGVEYVERDVSDIDVMAELIMNNVFATSVPILEVDGKYYFVSDLFDSSSLKRDFVLKILGRC